MISKSRILTSVVVLLSTVFTSLAFTSSPSAPGLRSAYTQIPASPVGVGRTAMYVSERQQWSTDGENKPQLSSVNKNGRKRTRNLMLSSGALALAVVVASPVVSNAIDLASIQGGAAGLATQTNNFMASIGETGFYQSFSLVFLSEIGDKTFFIAGLLAAQTSRFISFVGSTAALAVMTVISVVIGQVFHAVPSGIADGIPLDDIAAVLAFAFFGFKTLKDALDMEEGESVMDEEFAEAEEDVEESGIKKGSPALAQILSIFGLVFAAEFGDRSFLSTIALSAAQNPVSVGVGAIAAHAVATGIAVAGGAVVAKYLSERVIGIIGGTLFLVFAVTTALGIF